MKNVLTIALGISASVAFFASCVAFTFFAVDQVYAHASERPKPQTVWTAEPTHVDVAAQTYERLPPRLSTYAEQAGIETGGSVSWMVAQAD